MTLRGTQLKYYKLVNRHAVFLFHKKHESPPYINFTIILNNKIEIHIICIMNRDAMCMK